MPRSTRIAPTRLEALMVVMLLGAPAAGASPDEPRFDIFTGIEATANAASGYVGGGFAFGNSLYAPGLRLKAVMGGGAYGYDGGIAVEGKPIAARIHGEHAFVEASIGYQLRFAALTVRPSVGIAQEAHRLTPDDPRNPVRGDEVGGKLAMESWPDLGPKAWASLDGSYTTAFDEYRSFARVGCRVAPWLAAGLEGGVLSNHAYDEGRGGGFVELRLGRAALTVSGGLSGDYLGREPSPYGLISLYRAF